MYNLGCNCIHQTLKHVKKMEVILLEYGTPGKIVKGIIHELKSLM